MPGGCRAARGGRPLVGVLLAQCFEGRPHLGGEQVGLFPGGEVAAAIELVVVDKVRGIRTLRPAVWCLIQLVWNINTTQACAMRTGSHPVAVGLAEKP